MTNISAQTRRDHKRGPINETNIVHVYIGRQETQSQTKQTTLNKSNTAKHNKPYHIQFWIVPIGIKYMVWWHSVGFYLCPTGVVLICVLLQIKYPIAAILRWFFILYYVENIIVPANWIWTGTCDWSLSNHFDRDVIWRRHRMRFFPLVSQEVIISIVQNNKFMFYKTNKQIEILLVMKTMHMTRIWCRRHFRITPKLIGSEQKNCLVKLNFTEFGQSDE